MHNDNFIIEKAKSNILRFSLTGVEESNEITVPVKMIENGHLYFYSVKFYKEVSGKTWRFKSITR